MADTAEDWTDLTHWDLTDVAALRMGLSRSQREILCRNVLVPDSWGMLDKIRHYMPLCAIFTAELTREAIHAAKSADKKEEPLAKLGHAMHFLQDSGNPWHSRPLLPSYQKNHTAYEHYVARNMREGFCFRQALMDAPADPAHQPEFTHRIADGAAHLARNSAREFAFLDSRIRTDPSWQESEKVAAITVSILTGCLRMCETQIHSYAIRAATATRAFSLPAAVTLTFIGSDERRLTL